MVNDSLRPANPQAPLSSGRASPRAAPRSKPLMMDADGGAGSGRVYTDLEGGGEIPVLRLPLYPEETLVFVASDLNPGLVASLERSSLFVDCFPGAFLRRQPQRIHDQLPGLALAKRDGCVPPPQ